MSQDENDGAVSAFISRKAAFDALLEKLAALSANHFGVSRHDRHWADAGPVLDSLLRLLQAQTQLEPGQPSASLKYSVSTFFSSRMR